MTLCWCDGAHPDFLLLARALDAYLHARLGAAQDAFAPYNAANALSDVALLYDGERAIACGALKLHPDGAAEIKRVFVAPDHRRCGLARELVRELEGRALSYGCHTLLVETNPSFESAVALYQSLGFAKVAPFGPYQQLDSLCMGKPLG